MRLRAVYVLLAVGNAGNYLLCQRGGAYGGRIAAFLILAAFGTSAASGTYAASGTSADDTDASKTVLRANDPITRAEAAVIVERLFGVRSSDSAIAVYADASSWDADTVPAWSADAFCALRAAGILSVSDPDGILDRAQTAVMLAAAYQMK